MQSDGDTKSSRLYGLQCASSVPVCGCILRFDAIYFQVSGVSGSGRNSRTFFRGTLRRLGIYICDKIWQGAINSTRYRQGNLVVQEISCGHTRSNLEKGESTRRLILNMYNGVINP